MTVTILPLATGGDGLGPILDGHSALSEEGGSYHDGNGVSDVVIDAAMEVVDEVGRAFTKHGRMHSAHEGISVIREELDELWDHVKADTGRTGAARKEAIQIAAMAIRYVVDVIENGD